MSADVVPLPLPVPALGVNGKNSYQRAVKKAALDAKPANENGAPADGVAMAEIIAALGLSSKSARRLVKAAKIKPIPGPSGRLGRLHRYSRSDVERLIADRSSKVAARTRFHSVDPRPDQPFRGEPIVAPKRPPALEDPALDEDQLDPVALGVELPRERSGEVSINRKNERLFLSGPSSKALYPIGPTPAQLAAKKSRDDARAAALAQFDPAKIKRV
jgi:hypothetical protein